MDNAPRTANIDICNKCPRFLAVQSGSINNFFYFWCCQDIQAQSYELYSFDNKGKIGRNEFYPERCYYLLEQIVANDISKGYTEMMTENEKKLTAQMLILATHEFSNHGCNDFKIPTYFSKEEWIEFVKEYHYYNGDSEAFDPNHLNLGDSAIMGFLAYKLNNPQYFDGTQK